MVLTCVAEREGKLSSFLKKELHMSTGLMKHLKFEHVFLVNGEVRFTNYIVHPGDRISVSLDEPMPDYPAQSATLSILYEDEALLAVDKPASMMVHPSSSRNTDTLANYVYGYYLQTAQHCAVHPVTRLDRDTLGVVILAKNAHVHALLCEMLREKAIRKTYRAVVYGSPVSDEGLIQAPIVRPDPRLIERKVGAGGKDAVTRYRVLERWDTTSLLELEPITGRTHQLRVHCAYMGWPIVGDPQYCTPASESFSHRKGLTSQLLCAKEITLSHPITGQLLLLTSGFGNWSAQDNFARNRCFTEQTGSAEIND